MQDLFREEISSIIQQEIKDPGIGFITVLDVKMTEDLKFAKIFYSVYGNAEETQRTVDALRRAKGYVKHLLGTRVKLKYMPEITFVLDTGQNKLDRIDELLRKVDTERATNVPKD
jgi:ribosome-binding factor A